MERWMSAARVVAPVCLVLAVQGCAFEFEAKPERRHGTVGAEMFRVVCMNLASQAFPNDLTGNQFTSKCDGLDTAPWTGEAPAGELETRALARLHALLARRPELVPALDAVFASERFADDELRNFLGNLIPLYDPPALLPQVTGQAADLLSELIREDDPVATAAMAAFARLAQRDGYRPLALALGLARPALAYPKLDEVVTSTLASVAPEGDARGVWLDFLRASALDLATADTTPPDPSEPGTLAVARTLLFATDDAFSAGRGALLVAARDHRGLVRPRLRDDRLPSLFRDQDGDGFADVSATGRLLTSTGELPTPFSTLGAALANLPDVPRDSAGRALFEGEPLYEYLDADRTLLAGLTRDIGPLLLPRDGASRSIAALHDFAYGLNTLLGDQKTRTFDYGPVQLAYQGPDTSTGPLFDLVYALGGILPFVESEQTLRLLDELLVEHESEVAGLVEAILYIDERADAHPEAHWQVPHEFWDDLIAWLQRVSQRDGMLEALLRALATDESAKAGPLIGNFMRFKDRVSYRQGKEEELEALGIDLDDVPGQLGNDAISEAVRAHRAQVNYPCPNPPSQFLGGTDTAPGCTPQAPHPAAHHKGIRNCPDAKPSDGGSCAGLSGFGLCSWEQGSCTCDCAGGLCRGDMTPTWRCSDTPTPGFSEWVDRSQADDRMSADGHSNQSLFQRTAALVHDLHVPAKLCNKPGARMKLYDPAGSNDEPAGGLLGGLLGAFVNLGPYDACALLNETEIVQFFAQSILGTAQLKLQNPELDASLDTLLPLLGSDKSQLMERQTQIRGLFVEHPTPQAVARMVFSPFDAFEDGLLDLPISRDGKRIAALHRDTIFAWEVRDAVSQASYYEALRPMLQAFDEHELRDAEGRLLDGYLFGDLITLVHRHWSSPESDATVRSCQESSSPSCEDPPCCDLGAPLFAYQSNGVSYEELVAEALVDAQLLARIRDVMRALDGLEVAPGVDGITVLARATTTLLDPVASCANGDCAAHPLTARDGRTSTTTNTGKPIARLTPAHLLFDALNAMDLRFQGDAEKRLRPWREARSQIVDLLLEVERDAPGSWHFENPRTRPLLRHITRFLRERVLVYRAEDEACRAQGGDDLACHAVRDFTFGLAPRLERSLSQPISAAALNLLERFWGLADDPGGNLLEMVHWLSQDVSGAAKDEAVDATLSSVTDLLQLLENTDNTAPVMRFLSRAVAPNVHDVMASGVVSDLDVAHGNVEKVLALLREVKKLDPGADGKPSTLTKLLAELVRESENESPIEVIIDTIAEVNRAAPGRDEGEPLDAADLRAVLRESRDFLQSERHGIERLYDIIQARALP